MKATLRVFVSIGILFITYSVLSADNINVSEVSQECMDCHAAIQPGLVKSWEKSGHARITPAAALEKDDMTKRMSATSIPAHLKDIAVGCYECHGLNTDNHKDAFEHGGYTINIIVSPDDCATCHPTEREQYSNNLMSHAYGNLVNNSVYQELAKSVNSTLTYKNNAFEIEVPHGSTNYESCLYCHGTKIEVTGMVTRETDLGEMDFPVLLGWPNQGVGRINPDGSMGACTSCHTRHAFSIAEARKPYTCSECHKGPDVPAYKVYQVSKHGNIFFADSDGWEFGSVPWIVGEHFAAPTCASCHVSLITDEEDNVIAERTHQFNDRLAWRLFGVLYAHAHPISADLSSVKNKMDLPLTTELTGEPVVAFLIDSLEQNTRDLTMQKICNACHSSSWSAEHFKRLKNTIQTTNQMTATATQLMVQIWKNELADGIFRGFNPFDEAIERKWSSVWLFYANSTRFTSAMAGGGDYGVFAGGRYKLTETIRHLEDWFRLHRKLKEE